MRTRIGAVLAAALVLVALAVPAYAQKGRRAAEPAAPPPGASIHLDPNEVSRQMISSHEEVVDVNNESTFAQYFKAFESSQLPDEKQQIATELTDFCVQRGLRPSPDAAEMFLAAAVEARAQGRYDQASLLCRDAETFHPESPLVHLALAEAARHDKGLFSGDFAYEVGAAFFMSFKDLETRSLALSNLALWLHVASFLVLAAFAVVLLARYQATLRHDVLEWFGGQSNALVQVAGLVALFLPTLIFLAGYWWIVYWAGVFMLYARWSERIATLFAIALFVVSGVVAVRCQQETYLAMSQPHASNLRCYANRIGVGLDASLSAHMVDGDPLQRTSTFLLASRYLVHGSYARAQSVFGRLLSGGVEDAEVHNNLGCILFYENRYQEAIQQFSKAIDQRPDLASAYLNRSLAENKLFDFTGAKDDQNKARKLDKDLFAADKIRQAEDWGPVPSWLPLETTRQAALQLERTHPGSLTGGLRFSGGSKAGIFRPAFSFWTVLLWCVFVGLSFVKQAGFTAHACFKCGRPFCARCKTSLEFESFCSQCVHLFIKQDGVSPEARLKKNYEVEEYNNAQRIQRAVFSLLAPGTGHLIEGRPFAALFILCLWCGSLAALFSSAYVLPFAFPALAGTGPLHTVCVAGALLMMALLEGLFGVPTALRREPPRLGRMSRG